MIIYFSCLLLSSRPFGVADLLLRMYQAVDLTTAKLVTAKISAIGLLIGLFCFCFFKPNENLSLQSHLMALFQIHCSGIQRKKCENYVIVQIPKYLSAEVCMETRSNM